jgi:Dockerin type I domain
MKKALFLLIAIPSIALARPHCGDVNNDTTINMDDVQMICDYDVGMIPCTGSGFKDCDVNRDGRCNIGDALVIAQCLDRVPSSCHFLCKPFTCPTK